MVNKPTKEELELQLAEVQKSLKEIQAAKEELERELAQKLVTEQDLVQDLELYKVIFDRFPLGISITDEQGRVVRENKASRDFHRRLTQDLNRNIFDGEGWEIIRPDGKQVLPKDMAHTRALRENVNIMNMEYGFLGDNREITWIKLTAIPIPVKGYGVAIAHSDISERKKAEEALTQAKEYAQNIIDTSLGMIVVVDQNRRISGFNKAALETFGYTEKEILGKHINILYADEKESKKISDGLKKHRRFVGEITNIRKNGETFPSILSANEMRDRNGVLIGSVGNSHDITDRIKAEEELKQKEKELRIQARNLEEVNTTLSVLLDRREKERSQHEADMLASLEKLVMPYLEKIAQSRLSREQIGFLNLVQSNLNNIASPFARRLTSLQAKLTPTELEVADLLRHGKTTKEIAELLNLSFTTISFHRRNIRRKLGLRNEKINLKTYLRSHA